MADREADDVGLDILQRAQIAVGMIERDAAVRRHRRGRGGGRAAAAERRDLREIGVGQRGVVAQYGGAEQRVLELADIARPVIVHQQPDRVVGDPDRAQPRLRSEEHTSELQSLMRISYAVFCLKKKTKNTTSKINTDTLINNMTNKR